MIYAANPLAENILWRNHQSLRDHILAEYHAYLPAVRNHLQSATSLIHFTFDNWTSIGGKKALTGICVHHLDVNGQIQDYLLGLPHLSGKHLGATIGGAVNSTLEAFEIMSQQVGYFVLDNATNNDTAVETLGEIHSFNAVHRRLRCTCHILNLAAQTIIWGKDKDCFENAQLNIAVKSLSLSLFFR